MKKIFLPILVFSTLFISSCSKTNSLFSSSWSYKGSPYTAISCIGSTTVKTLTATTGSTSEVDDVVCHFSTFPPPAGTYVITNVPVTSANQVYVVMNFGTKVYTIDNSASGIATVSVTGSKISIAIPSVNFSNSILQAADNGSFSASLTQDF